MICIHIMCLHSVNTIYKVSDGIIDASLSLDGK